MRCLVLVACAACSSPSDPASIDAHHTPDALVLDQDGCPPVPTAMIEIADGDTAYTPKTLEVAMGAYVRFVTSSTHDMNFYDVFGQQQISAPIGFSTTKCEDWRGSAPMFQIKCSVHGEVAMLTIVNSGP